MKRTIVSVGLLLALAGVLFVLWKKMSTPTTISVQPTTTGSSVAQLLAQQANNTGSTTTGDEVAIQQDQLQGLSYAGGGDYKPFFAQTAKQMLSDGKHIILYFYKKGDPTDEALDTDIQKRIDRIPAKTAILRVDYDSNQSLKDSFNVTQRNTLIFLDGQGIEKIRRAVGITTLAQIVQSIDDK